jgi:hypothetical protein
MNTISVERILVPKKAGKLEIGPARVAFDAVVGRRAASWMDGPWDDLSKTERRVAASNPLDIDVLSLPEPKPANFMGLVGAYSIQASADVTDVHVGDPITLTIRVTGPKPLERVPPIDLDAQRDLGAWFKVPPEPALPTVAGGAAVYTQTIRAATERVKEIPPIELPYFDVAKGEYAVAKSNAIPLNVTPTTEVTLKGMEDKPAESTAPEQPGGLAPMIRTTDVLADQRFDFLRALESPGWIAVLGAPVAVYALAGLVVGVRRRALRDPAAVRRRRALLRAKRRLRQASRLSALNGPGALAAAANAASGAVRGYIADMLGAPDGSQTSGELIARLRAEKGTGATAEPGTPIDQGAELLEKCDAVLFAGAGVATPAALVEEAGGVVDRLHGFMEAKS